MTSTAPASGSRQRADGANVESDAIARLSLPSGTMCPIRCPMTGIATQMNGGFWLWRKQRCRPKWGRSNRLEMALAFAKARRSTASDSNFFTAKHRRLYAFSRKDRLTLSARA